MQSRQGYDDMDDQDKNDVIDTAILDAHFMSTTKLLADISQLQQDAKGAVQHGIQPPHVSWMRRVLSWFRND